MHPRPSLVIFFGILLAASSASAAPILNGSFETGDLAGWTASIPWGIGEFDGEFPATPAEVLALDAGTDIGFWKPAGSVQVGSSPVQPWIDAPARPFADEGFMAGVGTGDAYFLPHQGT